MAKTYTLHTILPPSVYAKYVKQPETLAHKGLTAIVACIIQRGGERIDEGGNTQGGLLLLLQRDICR